MRPCVTRATFPHNIYRIVCEHNQPARSSNGVAVVGIPSGTDFNLGKIKRISPRPQYTHIYTYATRDFRHFPHPPPLPTILSALLHSESCVLMVTRTSTAQLLFMCVVLRMMMHSTV